MTKYDVAIIGGGASGLIAAGIAASRGKKCVIIEKNKLSGKKILITGKGRCNITNIADKNKFFSEIPVNPRFIYSSYSKFSNYDIIDFFETHGVPTKTERGGRVFPVSDKAEEVRACLVNFAEGNNVKIYNGSTVKRIDILNKKIRSVILTDGEEIECESVIIATGGASYPATGSTGDGYRMARELGHKIVEIGPSLVPLNASEPWLKDLMGLSLRNVDVTLIDENDKKIFSERGEMLFTHFGVSGPLILTSSRLIKKDKKYKLSIDLKPALDIKKLDLRIQRDFSKNLNKQFKNSLSKLLPTTLEQVVVTLSGIDPEKNCNQITKEEREKLVHLLKNFEIRIAGQRSIKEAIITTGGIDTKEVNPSTMESKIIENLYFCGEILDVDGNTGGYNLTIAFSTGYVAGSNC